MSEDGYIERHSAGTIWDVHGTEPDDLTILVHVAPAEAPDDTESYSARLITKRGARVDVIYEVRDWITSMWRSPSGSVFMASFNGKVYDNEGGSWRVTDLGSRYMFNDIWGVDDQIYCCGQKGVFFVRTARGWHLIDTGVDTRLRRVAGCSARDVYVLGMDDSLFHYDGSRFEEIPQPTNYNLLAVLCRARDEVYLAGRGGVCLVGNKSGWDVIESGGDRTLSSLTEFRGAVLVSAREKGIWRVEGSSLVSFAPSIRSYGIRAVRRHLFAWWSTTLYEFDGAEWLQTELNL